MRKILVFGLLFLVSNCYAKTVRVVDKSDGSIAIIHSLGSDTSYELTKIQNKTGLKGLPYRDIDSSKLPKERKYRNAWKNNRGTIVVDSAKKIKIDSNVGLLK